MSDYKKTYFMQVDGAIIFMKSSYSQHLIIGYQDTSSEDEIGDWMEVDLGVEKGLEHLALRALVNALTLNFGYSMSDIINIITTKGDLSKWKRGRG